jgi:ectoine hydroxylase-related dioxygenase (phytanoyl-CoA dioxygenase family)
MSALLTLQGAVAHCDMPPASGPTLYLPGSQRYRPAFSPGSSGLSATISRSIACSCRCPGAMPCSSTALFHAAGHNRSTDIRRVANLLQVSSPFGRAMEALDRRAMSAALYPALHAARRGPG